MPRLLPQEAKDEMIRRLHEGESIKSISRELGLWKSTIYHHYKKINGKKYQVPFVEPQYSEVEGEIVGIFAGDGSQYFQPRSFSYEVSVHFGAQNLNYAIYVKRLFESFFKKSIRLRREGRNDPRLRLRTKSKDIFHYFKHYLSYSSEHKHDTVHLKTVDLPIDFKIGFLRGLFDTDGSLFRDKRSKKFGASYCTTSQTLARQIQVMLFDMQIYSRSSIYHHKKGYKPLYQINILTRNVDNFLNTMQPFKAKKFKGL